MFGGVETRHLIDFRDFLVSWKSFDDTKRCRKERNPLNESCDDPAQHQKPANDAKYDRVEGRSPLIWLEMTWPS